MSSTSLERFFGSKLFGHPRAGKTDTVKLKNKVRLRIEWSLVNYAPRKKETKPHVCLDGDCALCVETGLLTVPFVWLRYSVSENAAVPLSTSHGTATPRCPIARDMGTGGVKSISSTHFCPL